LKGNFKSIFITTSKEDFEKTSSLKILGKIKNRLLHAKSQEEFAHISNGIFPRTLALSLYGKAWDEILTSFKRLPSTKVILTNLINESSQKVRSRVDLYNYPKTYGNMSDQLNFSLKRLSRTEDLENTYICMYNADSIISNKLPVFIQNFIEKNIDAEVIQQSALFLSNFYNLGDSIEGSFLKSIALLQTRWTLAHELPRILIQLKSNAECAHIVGHGLIIKLSVMKKVGYFPTNYVNEDLPFGYILKLNGYKIYPFPQLENAQSPTSIKSMFTQYTTWFYGAFHYPKYMANAFKEYPNKKAQAFVWGIKYSVRSILWLGLSITWLFIFVYPIWTKSFYLFLLAVTAFIIYAPFCFYMIEKDLNRNYKKIFGDNVFMKIKIDIKTYILSLLAYLTHSYGPLKATVETLKSILFKTKIRKMKTER